MDNREHLRQRAEHVTKTVRATLAMADLTHAPRDLVLEIGECIRRLKLLGQLADAEAWAILEDGERLLDKIRIWLGGS